MLVSDNPTLATPSRAMLTDDALDILRFAIESFSTGQVALAMLVEIRGGAARALGAQIAVSADGRYCGYVSGGCVEAAIAAEALEAMRSGKDRTVMFGSGSPFFDIALPCGGGISVVIHVLREVMTLTDLLDRLEARKISALCYSPTKQSLDLTKPPHRTGWLETDFVSVFRPRLRLVVTSRSVEADAVARLAQNTNIDVVFVAPNQPSELARMIDPLTAVALLHHDVELEIPVLAQALRSAAFYVGALGSTRTHRKRCDRLRMEGFSEAEIARIKAPIGIFGPTKDASSLALSVLADVTAARLVSYA
jgi:xanthine dehydrogenase accessory factor